MDIRFQGKGFDARQTPDYFLSGQVDLSGVIFAITDRHGACKVLKNLAYLHAIHTYDDWAQELDKLFHQESLLQRTFKSSTWTFLSNKATLIPPDFVQPGQLRTGLEYAVELDELDEIHYRMLPAYQAALVFAVPSPPANVISKYQAHTNFLHQQVQLLSLACALDSANRIVLHVTPSLANMVVFADNKLLLSNSYKVATFTDVMYNLLFVINTLNLQHKPLTLYCTGNIDGKEYQKLRHYFRQILPLCNATSQLDEATAATFYTLLTLPQCE